MKTFIFTFRFIPNIIHLGMSNYNVTINIQLEHNKVLMFTPLAKLNLFLLV